MASQQAPQQAFEPVLAALTSMQSSESRSQKNQAHEFLESFQKSSEAWNVTHGILQAQDTPAHAKLFAATTLKGKIIYDLDQVPPEALPSLRDTLVSLLQLYSDGPRPIQTQICVCLASLAIQFSSWKDVLPTIGGAIQTKNYGGDALLEFLRILPEEVTEGRKINMTEEELSTRTQELLEQNSQQVLELLITYAKSSRTAAVNPRLFECISSWLREIPASDVVNSPLVDVILEGLNNPTSFETAVDCMCNICHDTRDVDENMEVIQTLFPKIILLRPKILEAAKTEDSDLMKGITRLFAEAGEAWVVLIARLPAAFKELVEAVLECCLRDHDRDAISLTFAFWYELKQYLTLDKYSAARSALGPLFSKLVDIMVKHLEYPTPTLADETDLFDGDREQEERFREFRHAMGDVLKDCSEVIGIEECLMKVSSLIQSWAQRYATQASGKTVPHWQELEAPLFSLRAMGRMVSADEDVVLPQLIPLIVSIPEHEKLKFQAIMALGRYTEWTSQHPDTLEGQLNYVLSGFNHDSQEVTQAAALAFKFLGTECQKLLGNHLPQLHQFYEGVIDKLKPSGQEEVTEGVAAVVAVQPPDKILDSLQMFCDPVMRRILSLASNASDDAGQKAVADYLQLITIFVQMVQPSVTSADTNPAVTYCQQLLPPLAMIASNFPTSSPILERVCRCWRYMIISYRAAAAPLLSDLAQNLASGFSASRQGCFLWTTDALVREFSPGAQSVDENISGAVYQFYEQQVIAFLRVLNELSPTDLPDVIEDFFRLATDAVRFFPAKTITSSLAGPTLEAAISGLSLQQTEPLLATLHFLRDLLSFGADKPAISELGGNESKVGINSAELQTTAKRLMAACGASLVQRIMTGMMFTFPEECFPDASAILLAMFGILPQQSADWVDATLKLLPNGSLKVGEAERLMMGIGNKIQQGDMRKIRILLQDFTNSYRRRNVAPREGLGRLEATKFRFAG